MVDATDLVQLAPASRLDHPRPDYHELDPKRLVCLGFELVKTWGVPYHSIIRLFLLGGKGNKAGKKFHKSMNFLLTSL